MNRIAATCALAVVLGGCYVTRPIRHAEIEQVGRSYHRETGQTLTFYGIHGPNSTFTLRPQEYSKLSFHEPDGTEFKVRGGADLVLTTVDGQRVRFEHPVDVLVDGDELHIRAANQSGILRQDEIRRAEVRSVSFRRSILAAVGGSLAFTAAIFGAGYALR